MKLSDNFTLEEVLNLFLLPKSLGTYEGEEIEVNNGRFGPYVKFGTQFISLAKGEEPLDVTMERAIELIEEKTKADAPVASYIYSISHFFLVNKKTSTFDNSIK